MLKLLFSFSSLFLLLFYRAFPGTYNVLHVQYARQCDHLMLGSLALGVVNATPYLVSYTNEFNIRFYKTDVSFLKI